MKGFLTMQIKGKIMKLNEADDYEEYFRVYENLSLINPAAATTYCVSVRFIAIAYITPLLSFV